MRRIIVPVLALALAGIPFAATAEDSCHPAPSCPPKQVFLPFVGTVTNPLYGPVYERWPDTNALIVGTGGEVAMEPSAIEARWGGRVYLQNLSGQSHGIVQVVNGQPCFSACPQFEPVGVTSGSIGPSAASIAILTSKFQKSTALTQKTYQFMCIVHKNADGTPMISGTIVAR